MTKIQNDVLYQKKIAIYYKNHCAYLLFIISFSIAGVTITATENSPFLGFFCICTGHKSLSSIRNELAHSMTMMLLAIWSRMVATLSDIYKSLTNLRYCSSPSTSTFLTVHAISDV